MRFKSSIYKEKCGTSTKWESVKETLWPNFWENLRSTNFILDLWYQHHCNVIVKITDIKCGLLSKHLWVTMNFCKEILFSVITWNKKHSLKKVMSMINTLGKDFFAASTRRFFWDRIEKLVVSILWSVSIFFAFLEKRRQNKYFL